MIHKCVVCDKTLSLDGPMCWDEISVKLTDTLVTSAWICLCLISVGGLIELVVIEGLHYTELPKLSVILGLFLFVGVPSFYPLLSQMAIPYILHNVIGRTVYAFRDLDGAVHVHFRKNWHYGIKPGIRMALRQGGWFRKNIIYSTIDSAHVTWKVVDERSGLYPIIDDSYHNFAIGDRVDRLFEIMERFPRTIEYTEHLINTETERKLLLDERDGLIRFLLRLDNDIKASRNTLGRSKHAQMVRERIEAKLLDFPADLRKNLLAQLELEENQAAEDKSKAS